MGYHLDAEQLTRGLWRFFFKDLADKKKVITERDLEALVPDECFSPKRSIVCSN
jgi:hypothetical protein